CCVIGLLISGGGVARLVRVRLSLLLVCATLLLAVLRRVIGLLTARSVRLSGVGVRLLGVLLLVGVAVGLLLVGVAVLRRVIGLLTAGGGVALLRGVGVALLGRVRVSLLGRVRVGLVERLLAAVGL